MAKTQAVAVRVTNLNAMLRAVGRAQGPEGNRRLRDVGHKLAAPIAADARARAKTPQQRMAAPAIQARRDRVPTIRMGGGMTLSSSTPRRRQPRGGDVVFGGDFGGGPPQFPRAVKGGRQVFQAVKGHRREIAESYLDAVADLIDW